MISHDWKKAIEILIIGAFLITEIRAIEKDRAEIQHQAVLDRQAEHESLARLLRSAHETP